MAATTFASHIKTVSGTDGWGISCEIFLRWMLLDHMADKSTLVQAMAWCRQATSRYPSQCWPSLLLPYGITRLQWAAMAVKILTIQMLNIPGPLFTKWTPMSSVLKRAINLISLSLYSLSGKTSYRQISWSLEAARLDVAMVVSLWNLTGTSAAALPRYLPNFRAIGKV